MLFDGGGIYIELGIGRAGSDWNGSGVTKIGVYRNGFWTLDINGNGPSMAPAERVARSGLGMRISFRLSVIGDGSGTSKIGLFLMVRGIWTPTGWSVGVGPSLTYGQAAIFP